MEFFEMPRFQIIPGDVPIEVAARRMGMTLEAFKAALPNLIARGFPKTDPDTGNFDLDAIDAWRKTRHPHLYAVALSSRLATHQRSCKTVLLRGGANDEGQGSPLRRETRQRILATNQENEGARFRSGAVWA
jgi:hypothetical protein